MTYDYDEVGVRSTLAVTVFLLGLLTLITLSHLKRHLGNLKYAEAQVFIIAISICPLIIGWCSWVTIALGPDYAQIDLLSLIYMSITLLCFFHYTLRLIGWEISSGFNHFKMGKIQHRLISLGYMSKLYLWCGSLKTENCNDANRYLKIVKLGIYQFAGVLFGMVVVGVAIQFKDDESMNYGDLDVSYTWTWLRIAQTASALICIWVLYSWKANLKRISDLSHINISSKFYVLSLCILLPALQPIPLSLLCKFSVISNGSTKESFVFTHNLLQIILMITVGLLQTVSFQIEEFGYIPDEPSLDAEPEGKGLSIDTTPNVTLRIID